MGAPQGSDLNTDTGMIATTGRWVDVDGTGAKWVHDMIAHGSKLEDAAEDEEAYRGATTAGAAYDDLRDTDFLGGPTLVQGA